MADPLAAPQPPARTAKIVIIGPASSGKTSIRNRYFRGPRGFSQAYIATIGADFVTKKVEVESKSKKGEKVEVQVQLWDTAGQERFQALGAAFYRGADGCILVYSTDSPSSLESISQWYQAFIDRCPVPEEDQPGSHNARPPSEQGGLSPFPFMCLGNKSDLIKGGEEEERKARKKAEGILRGLVGAGEEEEEDRQEGTSESVQGYSTAPAVNGHTQASPPPPSTFSIKRRTPKISNASIYHTPSSSFAGSTASDKTLHAEPSSSGSATQIRTLRVSDGAGDNDEESEDDGADEETQKAAARGKDVAKAKDLPPNGTYSGPAPLDLHETLDLPERIKGDSTEANGSATPIQDYSHPPAKRATIKIPHYLTSARSPTSTTISDAFDHILSLIVERWEQQDELDRAGEGGTDFLGNVRRGGKNDSVKVVGETGRDGERKGWRGGCC